MAATVFGHCRSNSAWVSAPRQSVAPPPTPSVPQVRQLRLFGDLPPESWNRLGTKLIPKLRSGQDLKVEVAFTVKVDAAASKNLIAELRQILDDLGIADKVQIDEK